MNSVIHQTLGDQMEALRRSIQLSYTWESPEGAFARYLCSCNTCAIPFQPPNSDTISQIESRQLSQAPTLAAVGYEIAVGQSLSASILAGWVDGFKRLIARNPFPMDRMSFFFRPLELLGITLGAIACPNVPDEQVNRLKTILTEGESRLENSDYWTVILGSWAAQVLDVYWQPRRISMQDCSLSELALISWLTQAEPVFAQRLGCDSLSKKVDQALLQQSVLDSIAQKDVARSMLLYLSLERTLAQILQLNPSFIDGYTPEAAIRWLKGICHQMNALTQHLESLDGQLEFARDDQSLQIPILLEELSQASGQLQTWVAKALEPRSQINQVMTVLGGHITVNSPQSHIGVQQNFNAPVSGVAGNVAGNQNIFANGQQQTLAEAAQEIQNLLKQLETSNPTATDLQKTEFVTMAIQPSRRQRFAGALNAGWKEAIKELLDNPYLNVAIAILEGWQTPNV